MAPNHVLILNTACGAAQGAVAALTQAAQSGSHLTIEPHAKPSRQGYQQTSFRVEKFDSALCTMMASSTACHVEVTPECVNPVIEFLEAHPGTISDFPTIICVVSPEPDSQEVLIGFIRDLKRIGLEPHQLRVIKVDAPQEPTNAFSLIEEYVKDALPDVRLDTVLHQTTVFARAQALKMTIPQLVGDTVDFAQKLKEAHGSDEKTRRDLAAKLLVQRAFNAIRIEVENVFNALVFAGGSQADSLEENRDSSSSPAHQVPT